MFHFPIFKLQKTKTESEIQYTGYITMELQQFYVFLSIKTLR